MDSNNIYSQCIELQNGPRGHGKDGEKGMCKIAMLDRNVEEHYQNLKTDKQQLPITYLSEKYLLENRLFTEIKDSSVISPHHRDNQEFTGDHLPSVCQLS